MVVEMVVVELTVGGWAVGLPPREMGEEPQDAMTAIAMARDTNARGVRRHGQLLGLPTWASLPPPSVYGKLDGKAWRVVPRPRLGSRVAHLPALWCENVGPTEGKIV